MFERRRRRFIPLMWGALLLALSATIYGQDGGEMPLGDVARNLRKKAAAAEPVIDNDNLSQVMETVEKSRASGSSPVFSLDPGGKTFRVSSPDVTCSLSFSGKSTALLADPVMLDELPRSELAKLDGPAIIDGDSLQVSMHNGTAWELREVVIGLTIVRSAAAREMGSHYGSQYGPRIVPALDDSPRQMPDSSA